MRLLVVILCALAVALVGCTGASTPTATPIPPTAPSDLTVTQAQNPLANLVGTVDVPVPGTLAAVNQNETPNAPTRTPISIDTLTFAQSGGIAGVTLMIELHGDGTLIRDGQTSQVSAENVQAIAALLDQIDFFNLEGIFTGAGAATDAYRYTLTVDAPNGSRTIISQDGLTPPELYDVYNAIRALNNP
jgi:hypothetical protein